MTNTRFCRCGQVFALWCPTHGRLPKPKTEVPAENASTAQTPCYSPSWRVAGTSIMERVACGACGACRGA